MDKPERVGLVFPRSGQQLFVQLPAQLAQTMANPGQQQFAAVMEQMTRNGHHGGGDESSRAR